MYSDNSDSQLVASDLSIPHPELNGIVVHIVLYIFSPAVCIMLIERSTNTPTYN